MRHVPWFFGFVLALVAPLAAADLQSFALPWNDATAGITNLQSWQPIPAGAEGWVNISPAGHYQVNGRRIRFLGVDITVGDCFPPHDRAEAHAARLARFGFNAVRLHHMDANWDPDNVVIDYSTGTSRTLSTDRLERLHYFVAQLAAHGIYSDVNLLVSRQFLPGDGLGPEISQLNWKDQHVLGFFMDAALDLHREYATELLTAPNPYRGGLSLAQDPAVAFVEIMNENGLLQKWYENVLDTLPAPYLAALQQKWNAWLKTRYASTAGLLASWGATDEPLGNNLLLNGTFAGGSSSWFLEQHETAVASAVGTTDFTGGGPALKITESTAGNATWHVQLTQGALTLAAGQTYTISFWAKAANATPLSATLTRTGPSDYSAVNNSLSVTLGTTWQHYTTTFQAGSTESSVRLVFNGFGDRTATVWLADVRFQTGGRIGGLPDGDTLEAGSIPTVLHNPVGGSAATAGETRDWIAYAFDAEKKYWDAMESHIKNTLGYRGLVWGSIIANSPPNVQAGMDAMDSHAYWQHPQFPPNDDWDPVNWTVDNVSMVNSPESSTLAGIARQRVAGYPHNVTEYQHPSPNTYASEMPLLAAAYGALQDWDGIWYFEYRTGTDEYVTSYFDTGGHPGKMTNNLIAAALFRRGDVSPANTVYTMPLTPGDEIEVARTTGAAWSIADGSHLGVPATLTYQSRLALSIGDDATGLAEPPAAPAGPVIDSDTGQLRWDNSVADKGVVTVNTPRTKAVIGFVDGRSFSLDGVTIAPGTTRQDWCTIGLTLLDGQSFDYAGAGRGVIVATGDQENTGQIWTDASRTSVANNWGHAPTLVEVIPATITLPVAASRVSVWSLDARGNRSVPVTVTDSNGRAQFFLGQGGATLWYEFDIAAAESVAPTVVDQPRVWPSANAVTLLASADGNPAPSVQWSRNGVALAGAATSTLSLLNPSPATSGLYSAVFTNTSGSATSDLAIVGTESTDKVVGDGTIVGSDIPHPNGNVFDQVLVTGPAEAITSDYALNQITRTSFIDLDDDIVQVEFSGPGTLSVVLDQATAPAPPVNYNQPSVSYVKGHAGIVITGADERTNVSVFTVGRATAFDPTGRYNLLAAPTTPGGGGANDPATNGSSLFTGHADTQYDGIADIAFIAISSANGKFGGVRTSNANYFASHGLTGLYAPGVTFEGPVFIGNITAFDDASPAIILGSASDVRITGGTMAQPNSPAPRPVQVAGITALRFTDGSDSAGKLLPAQQNRATYLQDGVDVTASIVVNPTP
ncbi:MAG TPA: carbohydrate binding domain-containing protein [Opitutus sp.]|nr:carbohydrate binding domain-containing protein [Opitutus sp.]